LFQTLQTLTRSGERDEHRGVDYLTVHVTLAVSGRSGDVPRTFG
jgi:hypothetical protein